MANLRLIIAVGNNAAIDTFCTELGRFARKIGLPDGALQILRLNSVDREVDRFDHRNARKSHFDETGARAVVESEEFCEPDRFPATAAIHVHTGRTEFMNVKYPCSSLAMNEAAYKYSVTQRDDYSTLDELLLKHNFRGEKLAKDERTSMKSAVKPLYSDFLGQFTGVVCSTPAAASGPMVRRHFKPDIVLVDEAGRVDERQIYPLIAFYSGPWILVGDPVQPGPFVHTDDTAQKPDPALGD